MRSRTELIQSALKYMERLIGMDYSRTYRYRWYKGGSTDCSGYVYAAWLAAGWPLLMNGAEKMTSCYEVYADGFDLVYPDIYENIGKRFAKISDIPFEPGDIIFYSFGTTTRANKITHIAVCYDKTHIIHTANNRNKACIQDISYGDGSIVAVIRLKEGVTEVERPAIRKDAAERITTRRMQALLNIMGGYSLDCDGIWGDKTSTALKAHQTKMGLIANGICDAGTWAALCGESEEKERVNYSFTRNLKKGMRGEDVRALQELLNSLGYNCGAADGVFGRKTLAAVKAAQRACHLTVDGIVGRNTIAALGGTWGNKPKDELTVCTFNVKRGTYKSGTYKIIGSIVKDADIVGLQEVTPYGLGKIAGAAGLTSYMCETISGYGHAILTNFSVDDEEIVTLTGSGERRKLHHMQSGDVSIYNVHLHYTEPTNTKQLKQVADILAKDESRIVILTGDFNRQDYDYLVGKGFIQTNKGQLIRNTEGDRSIVNKIDQVFLKGTVAKDIYKYEAVKNKYSDHDALFVKINI